MSRISAALLQHPRRSIVLFAALELLLALAIPFILIHGYHTLLDSRTGTFVEDPTRADPGWAALVDPSIVVGVAEVDQGVVTGVSLVVHNPQLASAGAVVIVPGTLEIAGVTLDQLAPEDAVLAVSEAMRLGVGRIEVLDEAGWAAFLGSSSYVIDNPDPVPGVDGETLVPVGAIEVGAAVASAFAGRPVDGAVAVSVLPRRHLLWQALLGDPPATAAPLAADLGEIDPVRSRVVDLPVTQLEPVAVLDGAATEALVRDVVAFPAGAVDGDRLQVRVVDRVGGAALEEIAAQVAADGHEVVEIANAGVFDGGPTQVIAPVTIAGAGEAPPPELARLGQLAGVAEVTIDPRPVDEFVVTLVVGADHASMVPS